MKRVLVMVAAGALCFAGCSSTRTPTSPTNQPTVFTVQMSPANEVPPITNAEASATGTATITLNPVRDSAGTIVSATADFNVKYSGFPATTTNITAAHIHPGAAGVSGTVFLSTGLAAANATVTNGSGAFVINGVPVSADQYNQLTANPAGYYFNIHTPANPGGVMRGQLK